MDRYEIFRKRLKEERVRNKLRIKDVVEKTGIPRTSLYSLMNKRYTVGIQELVNLCMLFEVSADYLLGLTDERKTKMLDNVGHTKGEQ